MAVPDKQNRTDTSGMSAYKSPQADAKAAAANNAKQAETFKYSGNIDIYNRPKVKNKDGSISTVRTSTFSFDDEVVNIPTVSEKGYIMSDKEAVDEYRKTGKHLGKFKTIEEGVKNAQQLHLQQADYYGIK